MWQHYEYYPHRQESQSVTILIWNIYWDDIWQMCQVSFVRQSPAEIKKSLWVLGFAMRNFSSALNAVLIRENIPRFTEYLKILRIPNSEWEVVRFVSS